MHAGRRRGRGPNAAVRLSIHSSCLPPSQRRRRRPFPTELSIVVVPACTVHTQTSPSSEQKQPWDALGNSTHPFPANKRVCAKGKPGLRNRDCHRAKRSFCLSSSPSHRASTADSAHVTIFAAVELHHSGLGCICVSCVLSSLTAAVPLAVHACRLRQFGGFARLTAWPTVLV